MRFPPILLLTVLGVTTFCSAETAQGTGPPLPSYRLFVTNYRDDTVSVIDGDTRQEEKVLEVGGTPQGITHRPDPPLVAVANSTVAHVTLIDPIELKLVGRIETGAEPEDLVFSPDGKRLFVTSAATKSVHVLDVEARKEIARLPAALVGRPVRVVLSPDGARLYVLVRSNPGSIQVFDTKTNERIREVTIGPDSNDFGLSKDGRWLVSASFKDDSLTVVDTRSLEHVATHKSPTGTGLVLHPTESRAYSLASFEDTVNAIDYHTGAALCVAEAGESPQYGSTDPAGNVLFVAYEDSNRVVALDANNLQTLWRVGVGEEPADVEYVALAPNAALAKNETNEGATAVPAGPRASPRGLQ